MNETGKRVLRTLLQLVASGALTALVNTLSGGLSPAVAGEVLAGWQILVTLVQNGLEEAGTIPKVLK